MATLNEIAREAGVPKSAVSYVLRGRAAEGRISAERAAHIQAVAARLGYRPNAGARAVSTGRFDAISLLFRRSIDLLPSNLLKALCTELDARGQHLSLTQITQQQFDRRELLPRSLRELCVDGMLGFCQLDIPGPAVALLRELRVPVVWLNASTGGDCVRPDDRGAIAEATAQLLALGHRRIAYVDFGLDHRPDGGQGHASGTQRQSGYRETMIAAGLEPQVVAKTWRRQGEQPLRWGMPGDDRLDLARAVLAAADRPTAVIAAHPASAGPIALAALSSGLAIPRDLSLVGVHQQRLVELGLPLSTLIVPHEAMARAGVAAVLRKVDRPDEVQPEVVVPFAPPEGATIAAPQG